MNIQHKHKENSGAFIMEENNELIAEMVYKQPNNDTIIIEHTQVSEKLKGQGVGVQLLNNAVDYARKENLKIVPECSFVLAMFNKKEEYKDVWKK